MAASGKRNFKGRFSALNSKRGPTCLDPERSDVAGNTDRPVSAIAAIRPRVRTAAAIRFRSCECETWMSADGRSRQSGLQISRRKPAAPRRSVTRFSSASVRTASGRLRELNTAPESCRSLQGLDSQVAALGNHLNALPLGSLRFELLVWNVESQINVSCGASQAKVLHAGTISTIFSDQVAASLR